jgi:hypothetical protein
MLKFKQFVESNGDDLTVISVSSLEIDEINKELDFSLNESSINPYSEWIGCQKVLSQFGIDLPKVVFEDVEEDEVVVILNCEDTDYYFYYCYSLNEEGYYETFATVTDESGLDELLAED